MITQEQEEKMIKWFVNDITESLAFCDGDPSEERIQVIASEKTKDFIRKVFLKEPNSITPEEASKMALELKGYHR